MGTLQTTIKLNDEVSKKLNNINRAINRTVNAMNNLNNIASGKVVRNINRLAELESKRGTQIERNTQAYHRQNSVVSQQVSQHNTIMGQLGQWATKLRNIATIYYGIRSAIQAVNSAINLSDRMTMADARLGLMSDKDNSVRSLKTKSFAAAQRATTDYLGFTKAVTKMGILAGDKFADQDSIIRFTELMQKQFQLAGADTSERNAAMLQLTQAIASNRLGGDELRTIRETAPLLVKYIQESLGVGEAAFKDLAKEGKITADVIIKAMAESADKVEKMYAKLPLTGERVWARMKNVGIMAFQPIQEQFNRLFNNQRFLKFIVMIQNGFIALGRIAGWALKSIFDLFGDIARLFERFPLLMDALRITLVALSAMFVAFFTTQIIGWLKSLVLWGLAKIEAIRYQIALFNMAVAQYGFNAALAMCPITWFIYAIIAVIAAIYLAVAVVNHFAGTSVSATGIIAGCFAWLGALIANIFIFIGNVGSAVVQGVVNAWNWCANNVGAIFDNIGIWWNNLWIDAKVGFYSFINDVLSKLSSLAQKIQPIAKLLDIDLSGMIGKAQASITGKISGLESKKKSYKSLQGWTPVDWTHWEYKSLKGAYNKGYNWGSNLVDSIKNLTKLDLDMSKAQLEALNGINNGVGDMSDGLGNIGNNTGSGGDIAKNTGDTAKNTSSAYEQDYSYLRNWAYNKGVGNSIGYNIKIEQNNKNNIGSNMDLNRVVDAVRDAIIEGIYTQAEAVR